MIQVDAARAERLGLKPDAVARQLKAMFLGQIAAQVQESSARITDVRVRYPDAFRFGPGRFDVSRYPATQWILLAARHAAASSRRAAAAARPARPGRAAICPGDVTPVRTPDEQWRENQQPAIFVTAELNEEEAGLGSVVADIRSWMAGMSDCRPAIAGSWAAITSSSRKPFRACWSSWSWPILLVFIMLAFQFHSVMLPLLIFLTQPLSLVSGLFALWLTNTPLNVSSYMGAILLIGLDMKNGILLVEYIQQLRARRHGTAPGLAAGRPHAVPADPDDEPGGHPGPVPAGPRHRPRRADAAAAGDHGHRRLDGQHAVHAHGDPGRLPRPRSLPTQTPTFTRSIRMTPHLIYRFAFGLALAAFLLPGTIPAADAPSLELVQTIPLKGKAGKLDHLALDAKRERLLLANKVNGTLDIVDLKAGKLLKQVIGQTGIQGVAYAADLDRVFVGLGSGGLCNVFEGGDYKPVKTIKFNDDADNVRYDAVRKQVYVAHAEKALGVVDAKTFAMKTDLKLPGPAEGFQVAAGKPLLYMVITTPPEARRD